MRGMFVLAVVLLGWCAPLVAGELYKWTDENGVTHYSDKAPEGQEFEERALPNEPDAAPAEVPARAPPKQDSPRCKQLRANLAVYQNNKNIEVDLDGDGKAEPLDEAGHQREMQKTRDLIAKECPAS